MNLILSNTHIFRGVAVAVPLSIAAFLRLGTNKDAAQLLGISALVAGVAIATFSLACSYGSLGVIAFGGSVGAVYGAFAFRDKPYWLRDITACVAIGAVTATAAVLVFAILRNLPRIELNSFTIINGKVAPVYTIKSS